MAKRLTKRLAKDELHHLVDGVKRLWEAIKPLFRVLVRQGIACGGGDLHVLSLCLYVGVTV